jgi:integrase/recombinase XerD
VFLSWLPTPIEAGLAGLSAEQVTTFVMVWCPGRGAADAKTMVTALRSLLRFLHVTGRVSVPLVDAVPSVPGWRRVRLPQMVDADQVARVLAGCDRSSPAGLRDLRSSCCWPVWGCAREKWAVFSCPMWTGRRG